MNIKKKIENTISKALETESFEEILENFDLTPEQVFWRLFQQGYIDVELLGSLYEFYDE